MKDSKICIYGAGISGLVAAVDLSRKGAEVCVYDKQLRVGGLSSWHPSVHQQTFNLDSTSRYIGIDISSCFKPVEYHKFSFYGHESELSRPQNSYICEKGPQETSIESYLYGCALAEGVKFYFNEPFSIDSIKAHISNGWNVIVATGLEINQYRELGIPHTPIQGYRAVCQRQMPVTVTSLFGDYTNHDFAYIASSGNITFTLIFSRMGINEGNLERYKQYLEEYLDEPFSDWNFSTGCIPLEKNLVKDNIVLAGTISGMIDPFYLNGISGALVSGKIASLYFTDRERALREFSNMTRNYYLKRKLKWIADKAPFKKYSFPVIAYLNNNLKWVGVV